VTALDEATEQYIEQLLEQAPRLTPEQAALVVRTFGPKTTDAPAVSDAAA
jgi:hypothetical protein